MLKFTLPDDQTAMHMAALSSPDSSGEFNRSKTSYPPKQPRDVLDLIRQGDTKHISLVEWNRFISVSNMWEEIEQSKDVDDVILSVFSEAEVNAEFRQLLMLKAVLTLEHNKEMLPTLLFSYLPILSKSLKGIDSERFNFLVLLNQENSKGICNLLFKNQVLPHQLLSYFGWPTYTKLLKMLEGIFVSNLSDLDWWENEKYLFSSLKHLKGNNQIFFVEHTLLNLKNRKITTDLEKWLVSHCSPEKEGNLWSQLSSTAKEVLVKHFKFSLFKIHERLIERYINDSIGSIDSNEDPKASKRMRSRIGFWSNYSDRVLNSRLLVLKDEDYKQNTSDDGFKVSSIEPLCASQPTEIIILEFEKLVIVDQLRPKGAAVRIFNSEYSSVSTLINQPISSERDILILHQDEIHDHGMFWQWSLESLLRQKYKLTPNPGLVRFNSLSNKFNKYIHGKGLPRLDKEQKGVRVDKLQEWTESFMRLERMLGKYAGMESIEGKLLQNSIRLLRSLEKHTEYIQALRKEANKGHIWAMNELAHFLLTKSSGSVEERLEGEKWFEKIKSLKADN